MNKKMLDGEEGAWIKSNEPCGQWCSLVIVNPKDKNLIEKIYIGRKKSGETLLKAQCVVEYFRTPEQNIQFKKLLEALQPTMGGAVSHELGDSLNCKNVSQYENFINILRSQKLIPEYVKIDLISEITELNHENLKASAIVTPSLSGSTMSGKRPVIKPESLVTNAKVFYRSPANISKERDDGAVFTIYIKTGELTSNQQGTLDEFKSNSAYGSYYEDSVFGKSFCFVSSTFICDTGWQLLKELIALGDEIVSPEVRAIISQNVGIPK